MQSQPWCPPHSWDSINGSDRETAAAVRVLLGSQELGLLCGSGATGCLMSSLPSSYCLEEGVYLLFIQLTCHSSSHDLSGLLLLRQVLFVMHLPRGDILFWYLQSASVVSCVPETLQERSLKLLLVLVICFSFCPLLLVKAFSLSLELSPAFFTRRPCGSGRADNTFPSHLVLGVGICLRFGHLESTIPVHTLIISEMGTQTRTFNGIKCVCVCGGGLGRWLKLLR